MSGLELSARFFAAVVEPLIAAAMPDLRYGAARIGDGSEVLGFDTDMSADHNFGPSVQIFLAEADFGRAAELMAALDRTLPATFETWVVRFPAMRPVGRDHWLSSDHGVEILTLEAMVAIQTGMSLDVPTVAEWLAAPEQRLLTLTAAAVFCDDLGTLARMRARLGYFPRDVWLAKLAAQWDRVGEERAFIGRTGDLGDDLGSRLVAARLAEDLMRIAFLVERRYAPYAKWFGTAFETLECAPHVGAELRAALRADEWHLREKFIMLAASSLADLQVERGVPGAVKPKIAKYFTRPFHVINADEIAAGLRAAIEDRVLRDYRPGAADQFVHSTPVLTHPELARRLVDAALFDQRG